MNKKAYNTPKTEVTSVEIQSFIAASDPNTINSGSITVDTKGTETIDGPSVMSDLNINDVWE
jgi:hypothetical protein